MAQLEVRLDGAQGRCWRLYRSWQLAGRLLTIVSRATSRYAQRTSDSLELLLRDRPSDEKGGSSATLGFSFQQWWATLAIVERLASTEAFAIGLEVKEDVAILDSSEAPTRVEFCQIKKNERAAGWAVKGLHKRGSKRAHGTHEPSALAKLYRRRIEFKGHPTYLRFVSNAGFKTTNEDHGQSQSWSTKLGASEIRYSSRALHTKRDHQLCNCSQPCAVQTR